MHISSSQSITDNVLETRGNRATEECEPDHDLNFRRITHLDSIST